MKYIFLFFNIFVCYLSKWYLFHKVFNLFNYESLGVPQNQSMIDCGECNLLQFDIVRLVVCKDCCALGCRQATTSACKPQPVTAQKVRTRLQATLFIYLFVVFQRADLSCFCELTKVRCLSCEPASLLRYFSGKQDRQTVWFQHYQISFIIRFWC